MAPKLRVEVLIPTLYNPTRTGLRKPIEDRKHRLVKNEIVRMFGGISIYPGLIQGSWIKINKRTGVRTRYDDLCYKYEICINFERDISKRLNRWKKRLKKLFKQFEIYMVYYPLEQV